MAGRIARCFDHFFDELRARPLTLERLAAEVNDRNELTAILETEREQWGAETARMLGGPAYARIPHITAITVILVVGIQALLIRSRTVRSFRGINARNDAGRNELKAGIRVMPQSLFTER